MENNLKTITSLFEGYEIRSIWDKEKEDYYFSVIDVIEALTDSFDPSHYWRTLKSRMIKEGNETVTKCDTFKFKLEKAIGRSVISKQNNLGYRYIDESKQITKREENNGV